MEIDLPSCSAVVHVTEACDVTVVASITALVFTIDVCNSFGHAWEQKLAMIECFVTKEIHTKR